MLIEKISPYVLDALHLAPQTKNDLLENGYQVNYKDRFFLFELKSYGDKPLCWVIYLHDYHQLTRRNEYDVFDYNLTEAVIEFSKL